MLDRYNLDEIEFALHVLHHPECRDEEKVRDWLAVEKHQALLEDLRRYREMGMRVSGTRWPDVEKQWNLFENAMIPEKRMPRISWWWSIAAIVACGILVGILINNQFDSTGFFMAQESEARHTGFAGVKLVTERGATVLLASDSEKVKELMETKDVIIDSSGLKYVGRQINDNESDKIHTLVVPRGGEYIVTLDDGTRVWINSDSELRYPVVFGKNKRVVRLKGEAYFEVKRDESCPFVVETEDLRTRVLGTEFNIQSYPGCVANVTLVKGKVAVGENREGGDEVILRPGENVVLQGNQFLVRNVDVLKYTSWKDGFFYYDDERLEDILNDLGRWFDFTVFYQNPEVKEYRYKFWANRKDTTEQVIERLSDTGKLQIKINGKSVIVSL